MIKKKDGGRKKKNNTKESAAGQMFGENTTNEINLQQRLWCGACAVDIEYDIEYDSVRWEGGREGRKGPGGQENIFQVFLLDV